MKPKLSYNMGCHDEVPPELAEKWEQDIKRTIKEVDAANEKSRLLSANIKEFHIVDEADDDVFADDDDEDKNYPIWPQLLASLVACLGALSAGITVGFTSPALPELQHPSQPSGVNFGKEESAMFASILGIGAVAGAPVGSLVADHLGRKYALMFSGLPLVLGWFLITMSGNFVVMCAGRFLTGMSTSMGYLLPPLYISEIASKNRRGSLGALVSIAENLGTVLVFGLGIGLNYRWLSVCSSLAAASLTIGMIFMPESPRWALQKGDTTTASQSVTWLMRNKEHAQKHCMQMLDDINLNNTKKFEIKDFVKDKVVLKTILISLMVQVFIQYSGMEAVLNYGEHIFASAGFEESAGNAVLSLSIVGFVFSLLTIYLMEKWGRTILLMLSSAVMALTFTAFGICLYVSRDDLSNGTISATFQCIVLICLIVYRSGYLLGWGAAGLILPAELIPNRARGIGCGVAEVLNWLLSASVSYTFIFMLHAFKDYGTFWFYAVFNVLGFICTYYFIPETKGVSLEDLESKLATGATIKERRRPPKWMLHCIRPQTDSMCSS